MDLPNSYYDILFKYMDKRCPSCDSAGRNDYICLICGKHISNCCDDQWKKHNENCFAPGGLFLHLYSSSIFIYRSKHYVNWGSVYLDHHGETDLELK